jgi:hypothetical protein
VNDIPPETKADALALFREIARQVVWRPTVVEPEPHMYLVRERSPGAFDFLVSLWQAYGELGDYHGHPYRYLRPGDGFRYWAIGRILNRQEEP